MRHIFLALLFAGTFFLTPQDSNAMKTRGGVKGTQNRILKSHSLSSTTANHNALKAVQDAGVAVDKANIEAAVALQDPAVNLAVDADNVKAADILRKENITVTRANVPAAVDIINHNKSNSGIMITITEANIEAAVALQDPAVDLAVDADNVKAAVALQAAGGNLAVNADNVKAAVALNGARITIDVPKVEAAVALKAAGVAVDADNVKAAVALNGARITIDVPKVEAAVALKAAGVAVSRDTITAMTHYDQRVKPALLKYFKEKNQVPGGIAVCTGISNKKNPKFRLLWAKQELGYRDQFLLSRTDAKSVKKNFIIGFSSLLGRADMRGVKDLHVLHPSNDDH